MNADIFLVSANLFFPFETFQYGIFIRHFICVGLFSPTRTEKEKEKEEISLLYVHRFLDLYKHTYL